MKKYLTATISPSMLPARLIGKVILEVHEVEEFTFRGQVKKALYAEELIPAVGHENTANFLKKRLLLKDDVKLFNRVNTILQPGDIVYAAIPQIRLPEATEFSNNVIRSAPFRFFIGEVRYTKIWKEVLDGKNSSESPQAAE